MQHAVVQAKESAEVWQRPSPDSESFKKRDEETRVGWLRRVLCENEAARIFCYDQHTRRILVEDRKNWLMTKNADYSRCTRGAEEIPLDFSQYRIFLYDIVSEHLTTEVSPWKTDRRFYSESPTSDVCVNVGLLASSQTVKFEGSYSQGSVLLSKEEENTGYQMSMAAVGAFSFVLAEQEDLSPTSEAPKILHQFFVSASPWYSRERASLEIHFRTTQKAICKAVGLTPEDVYVLGSATQQQHV